MKIKHLITYLANGFALAIIMVAFFILNHFDLGKDERLETFYASLALAAMIVLFVVNVVELISLKFDRNASRLTFYSSLALFGMIVFDSDSLVLYAKMGLVIPEQVYLYLSTLQYILFCLASFFVVSFIIHDYEGLKLKTYSIERSSTTIVAIISVGLYFGLSFVNASYIAVIVAFLIYLYWLLRLTSLVINHKGWTPVYAITTCIVTIAMGIMATNSISNSTKTFTAVGINAVGFLMIGLLFDTIYLLYVMKMTKSAYQKELAEKKAEELQTNILLKQMNPHFIFNTLNKIKSQYSVDVNSGNTALDLLAKELRALTESGENNLVPLEKELELVLNYVEIINLDTDKPYQVLFNIEKNDFEVPYFSLQTIVENAIKYSGTNQKEDGYIEIKAMEDENNNIVIIKDNGVGFDVNKLSKESHGLKNTRDRLSLLLHGTLTINSNTGSGVTVTMTIPKKIG